MTSKSPNIKYTYIIYLLIYLKDKITSENVVLQINEISALDVNFI